SADRASAAVLVLSPSGLVAFAAASVAAAAELGRPAVEPAGGRPALVAIAIAPAGTPAVPAAIGVAPAEPRLAGAGVGPGPLALSVPAPVRAAVRQQPLAGPARLELAPVELPPADRPPADRPAPADQRWIAAAPAAGRLVRQLPPAEQQPVPAPPAVRLPGEPRLPVAPAAIGPGPELEPPAPDAPELLLPPAPWLRLPLHSAFLHRPLLAVRLSER